MAGREGLPRHRGDSRGWHYTVPDNARLSELVSKHRESVPRFLDHGGVGATNNLAEREVAPRVIARKRSAGNRAEEGAETHTVPASVLRTYRRQGRSIDEGLTELLRHGPGHVQEFDHIPSAPAVQ